MFKARIRFYLAVIGCFSIVGCSPKASHVSEQTVMATPSVDHKRWEADKNFLESEIEKRKFEIEHPEPNSISVDTLRQEIGWLRESLAEVNEKLTQ